MRNIKSAKIITKAIATVLSFSLMFGTTISTYAEEINTATALYEEGLSTVNETEETVTAVENNLAETIEALEAAKDSIEDIEALEEVKANAEASFAEAEAAIDAAEIDADAARTTLEEAKAELNVQEEKKVQLEAIKDQYYGQLVYLYATINGGKKAVFNEDGTLNVEESAAKLTTAEIDAVSTKNDEYLFRFGRYLTKELVEYMILHKENVDAETAEFTFGTTGKGSVKKGQETVVFTNAKGNDQVAYNTVKHDIEGNDVNPGATEDYIWTNISNDLGRGSHTEVTYKDKDGVLHTEYYNYIRKNSSYDETDFAKGNIYLAVVKQNENGTWEPMRVEDENNYDDYQKLTKALEVLNQIEDYNQAKADVDAALARVSELEERISALTATTIAGKAQVEALRESLEAARAELANAVAEEENKKNAIEEAITVIETAENNGYAVVAIPAEVEEVEEIAAIEEAALTGTASRVNRIRTITKFSRTAAVETAEETVEEAKAPIAVSPEKIEAELADVEEKIEVAEALDVEVIEAEILGDNTPLASIPTLLETMQSGWWNWVILAVALAITSIRYNRA